jgi:hypothetical protein
MTFEGVTTTDTHQQECERLRLVAEFDGEIVTGSIGTAFGSVYLAPEELAFEMVDFSGLLIRSEGEDARLYHLTMKGKAFECHPFTAASFCFGIEGKGAYIAETEGGPRIKLWKGMR